MCFFCYYLAPDNLKKDISSNFVFSPDEFHHRNTASIAGLEQRSSDDARNANYQTETWQNNNQQQSWQRNRNRPRNNYNGNQRNQGYNRQDRNRRGNNNYNGWLCSSHYKHDRDATRCDDKQACRMTHLVSDQPKNDIPSSGH